MKQSAGIGRSSAVHRDVASMCRLGRATGCTSRPQRRLGRALRARSAARQWTVGFARGRGSNDELDEQLSRLRHLATIAPDDHSLAATLAFNDAMVAPDAAEAERHRERARACAARSGVPSTIALSQIVTAFHGVRMGDLDAARRWADRAEPIVQAVRNYRMNMMWRALLATVRPTDEAMRVQIERLRRMSEQDQLDWGRVYVVHGSAQLLAAAGAQTRQFS